MSEAREEILVRVRAAVGPGGHAAPEVPRAYAMTSTDGVEMFIERLRHYGAATSRARPPELDDAVREALRRRGAQRVVAPNGLPEAWLEAVQPLRDDPPMDPHVLDGSDSVLTTCRVAIAATGTLVLDGSSGMGRRALTLVPDYHLCVVRFDQIVGSLPEAIARLEPTRPLTFISGPSATVDIEMVRVGGVHGPRTLEVVIAESE